jgi:hypothetical protein
MLREAVRKFSPNSSPEIFNHSREAWFVPAPRVE